MQSSRSLSTLAITEKGTGSGSQTSEKQKGRKNMGWNYYGANKYGNRKVDAYGQTFDSRKEARRYNELLMMQAAGDIANLDTQVKFTLIPAQREPDIIGKRGGKKPGKILEREVAYIADFVYFRTDTGEQVVEDTKGMKTKDYIIKRKLMLYIHGIRIKEV